MLRLMESSGQGGDLVNNLFMCYFYYYLLWPRNRKWFLMSPSLPDDGPSPFGYLRDGESSPPWSDAASTVLHASFLLFSLGIDVFHDGCVLPVVDANWNPHGFFCFAVKTVPRSKSDAEVDSRGRAMPVPTRSSSLKPTAKRLVSCLPPVQTLHAETEAC